jgi:hypothetical protein
MEQQDSDRTPVRRRTVREDVRRGRVAVAAVRPFNLQIGQWQAAVVRLIGSGEWRRAHGRLDGEFAAEVAALRLAIETGRRQFVGELEVLSPEMQKHGRVEDTLKALETVLAGLDRAARLTQK